jgi:predicted dehydrogenase
MSEIRVGVVGAGDNTRTRHIPNLQAIPGVTIEAVCNRSRASSEKVAQQFGIKKIYSNFRELVADPNINVVMIGTWPYMHSIVTIAALEAGKHVMTEARMALNAAEARKMRDASRAHPELVTQVVPSPFTLKYDATIKKMIADGFLGDLLAVDIRAGGAFIDREAPMSWRQNTDYSGVNMMSLGIWYEAAMRWVGEVTHVSAHGKVFQKMRRDETGTKRAIRIPDHVDVVADLACGAQLHMQISGVAGLAPNETYIFGSEGTLKLSDKLYSARRGEKAFKEVSISPELEGKWRVEEEFVNAIRGKEKIALTTFDDGVRYMEFTEAVAKSILEGGRIAVSA